MSKAVPLICEPLKSLHRIDRRDWAKDGNGNFILVDGKRQLNWRCICGQTSAHSADYKGGNFEFIESETPVVQPVA